MSGACTEFIVEIHEDCIRPHPVPPAESGPRGIPRLLTFSLVPARRWNCQDAPEGTSPINEPAGNPLQAVLELRIRPLPPALRELLSDEFLPWNRLDPGGKGARRLARAWGPMHHEQPHRAPNARSLLPGGRETLHRPGHPAAKLSGPVAAELVWGGSVGERPDTGATHRPPVHNPERCG